MRELDCRNCRDYRGCIGKEWFNYSEIKWCPLQVVWLLQHKEMLRAGWWPKDPYGSGDTNSTSRTVKTEATYVKPGIGIAEVDKRLEWVGWRAELLTSQVEDGRTVANLSRGARDVLMYVSGWPRKDLSFSDWKKQREYRRSKRQEMTTKR